MKEIRRVELGYSYYHCPDCISTEELMKALKVISKLVEVDFQDNPVVPEKHPQTSCRITYIHEEERPSLK